MGVMTTIIKSINKNRSLILSHIGQRGDVHPDCDYRSSGFMNPREKTMANNQCIEVTDNTDIFALAAGRYRGSKFKNAPNQVDDSTAIVDIYEADGHQVIDYYWINAHKVFHAFNGLGSSKPVWFNPIVGRKQTLKNGAKGSVIMSVYRYDDNVRVKLHVDVEGLQLAPGQYVDIASVELVKFYPRNTVVSYASGSKDPNDGLLHNMQLQITDGGNIRIINTDTSISVKSYLADVEYTIDNVCILPDSNI